ncbi:hypothetical protein SELMODRAFT_174627 [Selaginella moellendorffii]|uniref:protein-serine/threonine phosphatase n=1 Tax=Selaginella moellendorffii TaxID=88036 RepID=D8RVC6_SELML|nr:probable protein phosphatase 2C 9 [Selaginella moellendorffii]EFJ23931.1 hypothetical protein SELMODRAFT_174627 [Selaginella moellendorffii]|eukprot:XP_002975146.1 probable protein phosphatase 2C 9 [Selaginella moellendorffii]
MDALAPCKSTDDACPCKGVGVDVLPCESAASALRRKRIEIRRIRILANSGNGLFKRSRINFQEGGGLCKEMKSEEEVVEHKQQQQGQEQQQQQQSKEEERKCSEDVLPSLLSSSSSSSVSSEDLPNLGCCCSSGQSSCPPYGTVSVCGRRREMEDTVATEPDFLSLPCSLNGCSGASTSSSSSYHFFGVYDGHGGSQAATYCRDRLHRVLVDEMNRHRQEETSDPEKLWEDVMTGCFLKVDEQVRRPSCGGDACSNCAGNGCDVQIPETVGSTAVVAVVGCSQIVVANCGDCRAVLSRGGRAIPLTVDHKPSRPDEFARVEAAGGQVINWDIPRILGILAMSRSIGDQFMTPFLIANPEVTCLPRHDNDECLILASDGLWDKVTNEAACDIARKCLSSRRPRRATSNVSRTSTSCEDEDDSPCGTAASLLLKVALHNGSKDNITVVVIDLKRNSSSTASMGAPPPTRTMPLPTSSTLS